MVALVVKCERINVDAGTVAAGRPVAPRFLAAAGVLERLSWSAIPVPHVTKAISGSKIESNMHRPAGPVLHRAAEETNNPVARSCGCGRCFRNRGPGRHKDNSRYCGSRSGQPRHSLVHGSTISLIASDYIFLKSLTNASVFHEARLSRLHRVGFSRKSFGRASLAGSLGGWQRIEAGLGCWDVTEPLTCGNVAFWDTDQHHLEMDKA